MTYLTCLQEVAHLVGVAAPTSIGDYTPVATRFKRFADRAGQEIARRADWQKMHRVTTFVADGDKTFTPLPDGFNRFAQGNPVYIEGGEMLRGATSTDEYIMLQMLPQLPGGGVSRFYTVSGGNIHFLPKPAADTRIIITYITSRFIVGSTIEHFTLNEDQTSFPERLLVLNMVWRWRRAQGAPYDDELKEFEAELAGEAAADAGLRPPQAQAA
jgi:hypothetical protein